MRKLTWTPQHKSLTPFEGSTSRPGGHSEKSTLKAVLTYNKRSVRKTSKYETRKYDTRPQVGTAARRPRQTPFVSNVHMDKRCPLIGANGQHMGECHVVAAIRTKAGGARPDTRYRVQVDGKNIQALAHKVGNTMRLIGR